MDKETKITYSVIAVLIIVLGALAYNLQPMQNVPPVTDKTVEVPVKKTATSQTPQKTIPASTTPTASMCRHHRHRPDVLR